MRQILKLNSADLQLRSTSAPGGRQLFNLLSEVFILLLEVLNMLMH